MKAGEKSGESKYRGEALGRRLGGGFLLMIPTALSQNVIGWRNREKG